MATCRNGVTLALSRAGARVVAFDATFADPFPA